MTKLLLKDLIKDNFIIQREVAEDIGIGSVSINLFLNCGKCPRWLPRPQFNDRIKTYLVEKCGLDEQEVDEGLTQLERINSQYEELRLAIKSPNSKTLLLKNNTWMKE